MNTFIPITSSYLDQTGALIAIGAAKLPDVGGSAAAALTPLWQMSQSAFAGEAEVELAGGVASVKARISQDVAAEKTTRKVYRGFSLALLQGADNSLRIARIALVDAPDAVEKGTGALFLKISRKAPPMLKSVLIHDDAVALQVREARDRQAEEKRIAKADLPGGNPPYREALPQWQGTATTAGGAGRDRAPAGQDEGGDRCLAAIRQAMSQPYRENEGLIQLLGSRAP